MTHGTQKLGDLIAIKHGFAFASEYFKPAGPYVLLTPGNFEEGGGFKFRENQKHFDGPIQQEYALEAGALLIAMTEQGEGLLGSAAFVPPGKTYLHNQRLGLVIPRAGVQVDLRYIYYLFNSRAVRQQIRATATGAKIRHTAPSRVYAVDVPKTCIGDQRRIASILGAYDDLIEVNRRRRAVLEAMARGLFEEWFVRFRFPGHIIDTPNGPLPEGWRAGVLGDLIDFEYGKALKADTRVPGAVSVFGSSGKIGFHNVAFVPGPGIIVGRKGNVGSLIWSKGDFWPIDTVYYVRSTYPLSFLFHLLGRLPFQNTDAAVPGLNRSGALKIPVAIPPLELAHIFDAIAAPIRAMLDNLEASNDALAAARDLLLPRLISGELSVTTAEHELEAAA